MPTAQAEDPVVARGPAASSTNIPKGTAQPGAEPQLVPIQISPQRLQQIGVTTAVAQMKNVNDQLRIPGNVDIDEQSLS